MGKSPTTATYPCLDSTASVFRWTVAQTIDLDGDIRQSGDSSRAIRSVGEGASASTLLIFLLKGVRPNKYRDNATLRHEFEGPTLLVGPREPPALEPPSN